MSKEYIVHLLNSYKTMLMNNKSEKIVRPDAVNGRFQPCSIFDLYIRTVLLFYKSQTRFKRKKVIFLHIKMISWNDKILILIQCCLLSKHLFVDGCLIKDEVLLTVGCPIFPPFYIDSQISVHRKFKKNRSIDI